LGVKRFYDVGALVYYLKAIPWEVPSFSVEKYFGVLQRINRTILRRGYTETERHRCLIVAHKAVDKPAQFETDEFSLLGIVRTRLPQASGAVARVENEDRSLTMTSPCDMV
jgi:hypothetical protein